MHLATTIGADIQFTGDENRASVDSGVAAVADELRAAGHTPYPMGRGGATAVGALGYLTAARELAGQLADAGCLPTATWLATGSCGTQAGLVAGAAWQGLGPVVGVTVSRPAEECVERVTTIARAAADLAGVPAPDGPPTVVDGHIGPGYGKRSPRATPPPSWWRAPRACSSIRSSRRRRWPGCWPRSAAGRWPGPSSSW